MWRASGSPGVTGLTRAKPGAPLVTQNTVTSADSRSDHSHCTDEASWELGAVRSFFKATQKWHQLGGQAGLSRL